MRVSAEAWAAQVERADRAQLAADSLRSSIRLVLAEHDSCVCRHTRRILSGALGIEAMREAREAFATFSDVEITETVTNAVGEATASAQPEKDSGIDWGF